MKKRVLKVCTGALALLAAGLIYAVWCKTVGIGIPCIFHTITGFYCPGCGVTRMCLALLRLDFKAAFYYNPAVFILLPVFGTVAAIDVVRYIKTGSKKNTKAENIVLWAALAVLLVFGVIRNIPVILARF